MLRLGYRIIDDVGPTTLRLAAANRMDLSYDCFLGDVLISDENADISARWGWVPVLDFALSMNFIAHSLVGTERAQFEFTESDATIEFIASDGMVKIMPSYTANSVSSSLVEMQTCASNLLRGLRGEIEGKHPELLSNLHYKGLFESA